MADNIQPELPRGPAPRPGGEDIQQRPDEAPSPERRERRPPRRDEDEDYGERVRRQDDGISTLIPYKNPTALISYYCGVFALIPCVGLILGPIALVLGILGLAYKKKHPTAHGTGHAIAGIVLGTLVLVGHLAVILLGGAAAIFGK